MVRSTLPGVISQHLEHSTALRQTRSFLVRAPRIDLRQLRRHDDRIAAHLDGLVIAGPDGWRMAVAALESPQAGQVFTATVLALHAGDVTRLLKLLSVAETLPSAQPGLMSAFGWVPAAVLRGVASTLVASKSAFHRLVGLATCAMHRVDPGSALEAALNDASPSLRARSLRAVAELGRVDLAARCAAALQSEDGPCRYQAARAATLLGDRGDAIAVLQSVAIAEGPHRCEAMRLLLKVTTPRHTLAFLKGLSQDPGQVRTLIQGAGAAGDPHYVPWLVARMGDAKLGRLAGESFSLITGLDLVDLGFEGKPPVGLQQVPSDNPDDADVAMDEDDDLPWPDPEKIGAWWQDNGMRFTSGSRYFMGEPPTPGKCLSVLRTGGQRQRIAAAEHQTLLNPGIPLFNVVAPARRQLRLLGIDGR